MTSFASESPIPEDEVWGCGVSVKCTCIVLVGTLEPGTWSLIGKETCFWSRQVLWGIRSARYTPVRALSSAVGLGVEGFS